MRPLFIAGIILLAPSLAFADPVGRYEVRGTNPDDGQQYTGMVRISRTGATYKIVWDISGSQITGTGVGARMIGGQMRSGPASPDDTAISISYRSGDVTGIAVYYLQDDGHWQGAWAYEKAKLSGTEDWYSTEKSTAGNFLIKKKVAETTTVAKSLNTNPLSPDMPSPKSPQ
jgi:hypothetical protein